MGISTIVYLQMAQPPSSLLTMPREPVRCLRRLRVQVPEYLQWYSEVGRDYQWRDRLRMPSENLRRILEDPAVEIWAFLASDQHAGYVELDRRQPGEVEIAYFGLFPPFLGRGLGRYFLDWTVRQAWSYRPSRVWLHTCDRDHPAALPNYQRAGFSEYGREAKEEPD